MRTLLRSIAWAVLACAPLAFASDDGPEFPDDGDETPVVRDLTSWQTWWDWNEPVYTRIAEHVRADPTRSGDQSFYIGAGQRPVPKQGWEPDVATLRDDVVPELAKLAAGPEQMQLRGGALVALGRIGASAAGEVREGQDLVAFLSEMTTVKAMQVAESALLALGLCGDPNALQVLGHVLHDDDEGRKVVQRSSVPYQLRAIAAYALGLGAERASIGDAKRYAALQLTQAMTQRGASRDQQVACALALSLCTIEPAGHSFEEASELPPSSSREALVAFLLERFESDRTEAFARAHTATALGRLSRDLDVAWRERVVDSLRRALARGGGGRNEIRQSAALALGMLADADDGGVDEEVRKVLAKSATEGDQQVQFFSIVALAQVGSRPGQGADRWAARESVEAQLIGFVKRGSSRGRPWAGMALGLFARGLLANGEAPSDDLIDLLAKYTNDTASPEDVGGYGVGLGLARGTEHREELEARVWDFRINDRARGDLTIALGLMGEARSAAMLEEMIEYRRSRPLMDESVGTNLLFRPYVLERTSSALALLERKDVVPTLLQYFDVARSQQSRVAVVQALAEVGDKRAVGALLAMLKDSGETALTRAEVAVALGQIGDPFALPWQASFTVGVNYRARTETFGDPTRSGILDLR